MPKYKMSITYEVTYLKTDEFFVHVKNHDEAEGLAEAYKRGASTPSSVESSAQNQIASHVSNIRVVEVIEGFKHIVKEKGRCGGRAVIGDTRIPVWAVAAYFVQGGRKQVMEVYPTLSRWEVDEAVKYYREHTAEIEHDIEDQERE